MQRKGERVTIECFAPEMDANIGRLILSHMQPSQDELDALLWYACRESVNMSSRVVETLLDLGANHARRIECEDGDFCFERDASRKHLLVLAKHLAKSRQ